MKDACGLHGFERENFAWMIEILTGVEQDHEEFRSNDASDSAVHSQIRDLLRGQANTASQPKRYSQPGQESKRDEHAVGGNVKRTDADELGKHAVLFVREAGTLFDWLTAV
jgi:hypothetical protein